MNLKGVCYDVGHVFGRGVIRVTTRASFDAKTTHRELEIIKNDLHCNAVRIGGRHIGRLIAASEDALRQGLEVWLSPAMFDESQQATLGYLATAATAAERSQQRWPGRLVFVAGGESTLFMRGIVPGATLTKRFAHLRRDLRTGHHVQPLRDFLTRANDTVRHVFHGRVTYASLPFEDVDWDLFDVVGVDHYRDARVKDRYVEMLEPFLAHGKPVVVTEFGMRTYHGAQSSGALGFGIVEGWTVALHQLPLVGRFVHPRLKKDSYVRDEALQARELSETVGILDAAGVDGAFVATFVDPMATFSEDPRHDLDMSSLGLVKTLADEHGTTYPDMTWEPKEAFRAVADFYAGHATGVD